MTENMTLRQKYGLLGFLKETKEDYQSQGLPTGPVDEMLAKVKREIREILNKEPHGDDKFIVNGGGTYDEGWTKYFYPDEHWTEEEKSDFTESNWIHMRPSQYDCTGQLFTWNISIFDVPNGTVVYHQYALDV